MLYVQRKILADICEQYLIAISVGLVDGNGLKVRLPKYEKVEDAILGLMKITTGQNVMPDDTRDINNLLNKTK